MSDTTSKQSLPSWLWPGLVLVGTAVLYVLLIKPHVVGFEYDDGVYLMASESLAKGHGYHLNELVGNPALVKYPPLFPLVMMPLWWIFPQFPENLMAFKLLNLALLLGFLASFWCYARKAEQLPPGRAVLLLILLAFNFNMARTGTNLFSEPLFLLLLVTLLWELHRTPPRWHQAALISIALLYTRSFGIVAIAAEVGTKLPSTPDAAALDAFLEVRRRDDPDHFPDLSLSVVKMLGSGEYALELPGQKAEGHFGLAVRDYNHSTAPNRRFPDLVAQRLLKAAMEARSSPYSNDELATLARHCTEQEDNANKVERQVRKSAAALLLHDRINAVFDAIVTGASDKGTWVRIPHPAVEGRVVRGTEGLDVGDRVRVRLLHTDVERGFIDFARADGQPSSSR